MPVDKSLPLDLSALRDSAVFSGLDDAALAAIARAARRKQVRAGSFFFHQGSEATVLYVLTSGRVKLTQVTPEGHQVLLRVVGPGELFGMVATFGDPTYPATAQADDDCRALAWDSDTVASLMERFPRLATNILRVVSARLRDLQDRYRELATERVERRVARALIRLAGQVGRKVDGGVLLELNLSRRDLAEMTGTTLFTVSRILSGWEQRGLIESGRARILIKRPHGLVVIAEDLNVEDRSET